MPEEFGTVNVKREDRAREIEAIRQRFRRHRDTLTNLAADAPTLALASEYNRLIKEIDIQVGKLGVLEARTPNDTQPLKRTEPGRKPLTPAPAFESVITDEPPRATSRILLIVLAGLVVLGAIAWLMWQASVEPLPLTSTVASTETTATTVTIEPVTPVPEPVATGPALTVEPASQAFGVFRRGSRPSRQFEVSNNTDQPITLAVSRSNCRCLYYAHNPTIAPKKKETITVTIDATRVKTKSIKEKVTVSDKANPANETSFNVNATIR